MPIYIIEGLAAGVLTIAFYCYWRWRENIAVGTARLARHISERMPFSRPVHGLPLLAWRTLMILYAVGIAVLAVGLWAVFIMGVARPESRSAQLDMNLVRPADTAGLVIVAVLSTLFLAYGLHHVIFSRRWARWNEWLHNTQLPLEATYDSLDPPSRRWTWGMIATGDAGGGAGDLG